MTLVDSSAFGHASDLLGGSLLVDHETDRNAIENETFAPNGLLDEPKILPASSARSTSTPSQVSMASGFNSCTEASLLDEPFSANGLLSDPDEQPRPPGNVEQPHSQASFGFSSLLSQTQDDEFPDISDILKPYATTRTRDIISGHSSSAPLDIPRSSIRATTFDGKPVFLRRKFRRNFPLDSAAPAQSRNIRNLLDVPIHRLMDELSSTAATRLAEGDRSARTPSASQSSAPTEETMWVDRYRPKRFTELLGDDRVHREVMAWVKEWDWCVFGNKKGKKRARDYEELDEYRRPREKLLLISGPPGLGKTTLAHVVAKQAGYSVFEVNASDARSAQVVDDRIRPALESGSAVGSSRPVLVLVDEIDGATGGSDNSSGFVQKLVQLTFDRPKKKGRKGDSQSARPLLRPIICICNDLYANSLAKLRPHARIIRFNRPNDLHLVKRLRDICETEGIKAESRALSTLVGVAQGDLRGCLNTLQLIKARHREVTESVVRSATTGMKEADTSQTAVLNDLFAPMSRKRVKELGLSEDEEAKYVGRLSREIEGSGAIEKIAIGCFEHYATLHRHHATFSRYLKANEWLSTYDLMSGEMRSEREYAAMQYLSYMLVPFYPLFQERGRAKVERPKADWEHYTKTKTNEEIYKSLARGLRVVGTRHGGTFRHFAADQVLQLEFAPYINRIISPPLRPVNSQVIKPEERALLSRLVDIMVAIELRFIQERSEDGQLVYRLDPPIDVFVTYDGKRAEDIAISRYAVRHLVASEIDAQLINQQAEAIEKSKGNKQNFFNLGKNRDDHDEDNGNTNGDGKLLAEDPPAVSIKNKRARREEEVVDKVPTDFFGRPIIAPRANKPASSKSVEKKYLVTYRFNEGNSAAVRKPVKVGTLL